MTISDINSLVTFRTGADTTQYTAANRLISTNRWYHKISTMILDSMDGWDWDDTSRTDYPVATANLVANQQDYSLGTAIKILKINRVEVSYDGTNWYEATPFDLNQTNVTNDTTSISQNYQTTKPFYDLNAGSIFLYPIPTANVTGGLKIWYAREPQDFTSGDVSTGTKEPGFDEAFHMMIALGMCYDWYAGKPNLVPMAQLVQAELTDYEARLRKYYGSKDHNTNYRWSSAYINYK